MEDSTVFKSPERFHQIGYCQPPHEQMAGMSSSPYRVLSPVHGEWPMNKDPVSYSDFDQSFQLPAPGMVDSRQSMFGEPALQNPSHGLDEYLQPTQAFEGMTGAQVLSDERCQSTSKTRTSFPRRTTTGCGTSRTSRAGYTTDPRPPHTKCPRRAK